MKLEIIHPGVDSMQAVEKCIANGQAIRRSPHVGNVNAKELSVVLGISQMGGIVELEMVDTIQGRDTYSVPNELATSAGTVQLASGKSTKGRVVGACTVSEAGMVAAQVIGKQLHAEDTLLSVHQDALAKVMPNTVRMRTSSSFFASIGTPVLGLVLSVTAETIDRQLRSVDPSGKINAATTADHEQEPFGCGDKPLEGILPPLEAMMAIEFLSGVMHADDLNGQVVHVAGPDMIRYTKDPLIMDPALVIAERTLAELGMCHSVCLEYVVPGLDQVLESPDFPMPLGLDTIQSQHDLPIVG